MLSFGKFTLKYFSSILSYWTLLLLFYILISLFLLGHYSSKLKIFLFFVINLFVIIYFFGSFQLAKCWNLKQEFTTTSCVKNWNSITTKMINILILFAFAAMVFIITIFFKGKEYVISDKKIDTEEQITICLISMLAILVFYIYGYLLSQIKNLYSSLFYFSSRKKYILPPTNISTTILWGIILITVIIYSCIKSESESIGNKSVISILVIFFYLYRSIDYILKYLKENNFNILTEY